MTTAKVTKTLTAWREVLAASEDSISLAETIAWLERNHPEVEMPPRALLICNMTSMLTATLSIESVVNDILQSVVRAEDPAGRWVRRWIEAERLPLREKMQRICESMGCTFSLDEHPFLIVDEMLDFRDRIVHAKPELVEVHHPVREAVVGKAGGHAILVTSWERACTMENAVRFHDAAETIAHWFIANSDGRYSEGGVAS
jgi:hypothetical protein